MGKLQKVLIMAGGTGGHVFPGLAVAKQFRDKNIEVHWLGTEKGLESRLVPAAQIPIHYVSIAGLRGKGWKDLITAPWRLTKAILQSLQIIRRLQPDIVIGMGGFVSGPGGIASALLGYPLVIHEQNAKLGLTNKWLSLVAKKSLQGFPDTFTQSPKVITTGNPVRAEIINLPNPEARFSHRTSPLHVLVVGGSLGAQAINALIPEMLALIPEDQRPEVRHQTGEKHYPDTLKAYEQKNVRAEINPFITDMEKAYAWADIVICRAGALTIAELCAAGVGAILVPYPFAVDDHQTTNAEFMVKNNAAQLIQQKDLTADKLADLIKELNLNREKCFLMAQSAYNSRKINAAELVLKICEEMVS